MLRIGILVQEYKISKRGRGVISQSTIEKRMSALANEHGTSMAPKQSRGEASGFSLRLSRSQRRRPPRGANVSFLIALRDGLERFDQRSTNRPASKRVRYPGESTATRRPPAPIRRSWSNGSTKKNSPEDRPAEHFRSPAGRSARPPPVTASGEAFGRNRRDSRAVAPLAGAGGDPV